VYELCLGRSRRRGFAIGLALCATLMAGMTAVQAASAADPQFYANGMKLMSTPRQVFAWGEVGFQLPVGRVECGATLQANIWNGGGQGVGEVTAFNTNWCQRNTLTIRRPGETICLKGEHECEEIGPVYVSGEMPLQEDPVEAEACKGTLVFLRECPGESEREPITLFTRTARRGSLPWKLELGRGEREGEVETMADIGGPGSSCYPKETVVVGGAEVERPDSWEEVPAGCMKIGVILPELPAEFVYYGRLEVALVNGVKNGLSPSRFEFDESGGLESGHTPSEAATEGEATIDGGLQVAGVPSFELITAK